MKTATQTQNQNSNDVENIQHPLSKASTNKSYLDIECKFSHEFFIVEGMSGLLFGISNSDTFEDLNIKIIQSATHSIEMANLKLRDSFDELLDKYLTIRKEKENTPQIKVQPTNQTSDEIKNLLQVIFESTWRMETALKEVKKSCEDDALATENEFLRDILFDTGLTSSETALAALTSLCENLHPNIDANKKSDFSKAYKNYVAAIN